MRTKKIYSLFIFTKLQEPAFGFMMYSKADAKKVLEEYKGYLKEEYQGYKLVSIDVNDEGRL